MSSSINSCAESANMLREMLRNANYVTADLRALSGARAFKSAAILNRLMKHTIQLAAA